ncbi:MAG: Crp/Fnr family transcriptional regulator [Nitrospira sp.]|nr:Crp/Fnr family transcriptional regulator [Nitrospira sp.]
MTTELAKDLDGKMERDYLECRNAILAALPEEELRLVREWGQRVSIHEGKILQSAGTACEWLFFPTSAALSLMAVTQDGLSIETGLIGQEGMVGLLQFSGSRSQPLECMVQHGGMACQLSSSSVRRAQLPILYELILRYAGYRLAELAQTAICNRFHLVRQRLSRWLLTAQDRTGRQELEFTQEMLSAIVGARRPVVTSLIGRMQSEGLIEYRRGCLVIQDRPGLETASCECYGILRNALTEYLQGLPVRHS